MEILTSNVQVWHLAVVVIVFVLYEVWPSVFPQGEQEQEWHDQPATYGFVWDSIIELRDQTDEKIAEIHNEVFKTRDRAYPAPVSYDDLCRLEEQFYEFREQITVMNESRWQRKVARWIGAI